MCGVEVRQSKQTPAARRLAHGGGWRGANGGCGDDQLANRVPPSRTAGAKTVATGLDIPPFDDQTVTGVGGGCFVGGCFARRLAAATGAFRRLAMRLATIRAAAQTRCATTWGIRRIAWRRWCRGGRRPIRFVGQHVVESLHFAVGLRPVGVGATMSMPPRASRKA
jgi:hypothetical protein